MFKLMFSTIKVIAIVIGILALGNWIEWDGETISDHIQSRMSHATRVDVGGSIKSWADEAWNSGKQTVSRLGTGGTDSTATRKSPAKPQSKGDEQIFQSERQKLRDLIRELNGNQAGEKRADRD